MSYSPIPTVLSSLCPFSIFPFSAPKLNGSLSLLFLRPFMQIEWSGKRGEVLLLCATLFCETKSSFYATAPASALVDSLHWSARVFLIHIRNVTRSSMCRLLRCMWFWSIKVSYKGLRLIMKFSAQVAGPASRIWTFQRVMKGKGRRIGKHVEYANFQA